MIHKVKFVNPVQESILSHMNFSAKIYIFKRVRFSYSFGYSYLEMNEFMTNKIVVLAFRS